MTIQPVVVELDYDGSWHEVPARAAQGITIAQGQADEGATAPPCAARLTLDNRSGDYNPRNTAGGLYGLIGRYTPVRISMQPGNTTGPMADASDDFSTNQTDSWGTADVGGSWTEFGVGGSVLASDFQVAAGEGTHNVTASNAYRGCRLDDLEILDCTQAVTFKCPQATGASLEPANLMFRGTGTTDYVLVRVEVTTANAVVLRVYSAADVELGSATVPALTHAGTGTPLRVKARAAGWDIFAKVWNPAGAEPDEWHLRASETNTLLEGLLSYLAPPSPEPGFIGIRSGRASGNTNNSGPQFAYDNYTVTVDDPRFVGEISQWKPQRLRGGDQVTEIEAHGVTHRLGQYATPLKPPLTRMALALSPVAYWPLDDQPGSAVGHNEVATGAPMKVLSVHLDSSNNQSNTSGIISWGADTTLPGSPSAPAVYSTDGSTEDFAVLRGFPGSSSSSGWTVMFCFKAATTSGSAAFELMRIRTSASDSRYWIVSMTSSGFLAIDVYDVDMVHQTAFDLELDLAGDLRDGEWRFVVITAEQTSVGTITVNMDTREAGQDVGTTDTASTYTLGVIAQIDIPTPGSTGYTAVSGLWVAGVGVWDEVLHGFWTDQLRRAAFGFTGAGDGTSETAGERLWRLCVEEGVPFSNTGDLGFNGVPGDTELMGVQSVATFPDLLAECAQADLGLLHEPRWGLGVHYRTRVDLYNQTAALALDFDTDGIAPPLEPAVDDRVVNDVTVTRTGGSKFRATLTSGALSTQAPPDGIGRAPGDVTVNVESDEDLPSQAYWRLHLGTWDEARYPRLTLYRDVGADLQLGDVVTITNLEPDLVSLMVVGYEERIESHFRLITLVCVPAGPYADIGIWDVSTWGDVRYSM